MQQSEPLGYPIFFPVFTVPIDEELPCQKTRKRPIDWQYELIHLDAISEIDWIKHYEKIYIKKY